ncbi:MAG: hypothetical protein ACN6I4_00670 [bacterium]
MRNLIVLLFVVLVACQQKNVKETVADTFAKNSREVETIQKENSQASENNPYDFGEELFDFNEDLTRSSLKAQKNKEYILKCNAIDIFQQAKRDIIKRKPLVKKLGLPTEALILEYKTLKDYPDKAIIIWGEHIKVGFDICEFYTCPQTTTGTGYFRGDIKISLVDTKMLQVINTIKIFEPYWGETGSNIFSIPFSIASKKHKTAISGLKYHTIGGDEIKDGMAEVIHFDDFTGNGKKLEFALHHQIGCVTCQSTLIGYDDKSDSLINYKIVLKEVDTDSAQKKSNFTESYWVSEVFTLRPKNGMYIFAKDYRGRGGTLNYFEVKFNEEIRFFEGNMKFTRQENDTLGISFITYPIQQ